MLLFSSTITVFNDLPLRHPYLCIYYTSVFLEPLHSARDRHPQQRMCSYSPALRSSCFVSIFLGKHVIEENLRMRKQYPGHRKAEIQEPVGGTCRLVVPVTSSMWDLHCTRPCPLLRTSSLAFGILLRCTSRSVYACAQLFISRLKSILKSLSSIWYL